MLSLARTWCPIAFAIAACAIAAPAANAQAAQQGVAKREVVLPEGTELTVLTTDTISSKTALQGDQLGLRVGEAVIEGTDVLIAKGAFVKATVAEAKGAGHFGKGGKLSINVESTRAVDGQPVKLRASKGAQGSGNVTSTVALTVLFGPIGLLRHGSDIVINPGTAIKVFTDQDVKVELP